MIEGVRSPSNTEAGGSSADVAGLTTQCGIALEVMRARPENQDELREFFRHVSAEDLRFRFLETVKQVDESVLRRMVEGGRDLTFLARTMVDRTLAAVATLNVAGEHGEAEVALSTRTDQKKKGISWTLLEFVLKYAKTHGFTTAASLEAADNRDAIALECEMGFVARLNSAHTAEVLATKTL